MIDLEDFDLPDPPAPPGEMGGGVFDQADIDALFGDVGPIARKSGLRAVIDEARPRDPRLVPANGAAGRLGPLGIEIGDDRDLQALDMRHLRQEHRAELAGADQRRPHRLPCLAASGELGHQVHGAGSRASHPTALILRSAP